MTNQERFAVSAAVANAILDAVKAAGDQGLQGRVLYDTRFSWMKLENFHAKLSTLVGTRKLRKTGLNYFVTERGNV